MNIKAEQKQKVTLPSPLFRDPIYDCPTDPTVIWNEKEEQWYLLYTQRRATDVPIGVSWVHGTALGVATSRDGTKWLYRGTLVYFISGSRFHYSLLLLRRCGASRGRD